MMSSSGIPELVLVGPPRHGVSAYATDLAEALKRAGFAVSMPVAPDAGAAVARAAGTDRVHVHFTDRIFGSTPEDAADLVERMAALTRLSVTLHDLPQPSDGTRFARRARAYGRVLAAVRGAVVSSEHEANLVATHLAPPTRPLKVIPIGTRVPRAPQPRAPQPRAPQPRAPQTRDQAADAPAAPGSLRVLIAGFIYPGKGHLEAIDAVAAVRDKLRATGEPLEEATVVAIGSASPGHEADVESLQRHAAASGVILRVTGYLDDIAYRAAVSAHGIPLAAHQHLSASRSMLDWVEQGRLPLVADSTYAHEMARLRPNTLRLYQPAHLADHLEDGWRRPRSTRLAPGTPLYPTLTDGALAYRDWWAGLL
jgi:glycosyltransferase involved in cell wall biosynthesis